jgi:hypothetical protein
MKNIIPLWFIALLITLTIACSTAPQTTTQVGLDSWPGLNPDTLVTYTLSQDRSSLIQIEEQVRTATPAQKSALSTFLVGIIQDERTTYDGFDFACRMLARLHCEDSIAPLAAYLHCPERSDMARYALEQIQSPNVDAVLVQALQKAEGKQKLGFISSISSRKVDKAIPVLSKIANGDDKQAARSAIHALGHIGGIQAVRALNNVQACECLDRVKLNAYLMATR